MNLSAEKKRISKIRPLALPVYIPNLLFSIGQGAIVPILAVYAHHLGGSATIAGIVVAANGFGPVIFDLPSGWIIARFGEEKAGYFSAILITLGLLGAILIHSTFALIASVFLASCGWSVWILVRLTHLSRVVHIDIRGRALSLLGGISRAGAVVGPLLIIALAPTARLEISSFELYLACVLAGFFILWLLRKKTDQTKHGNAQTLSHIFTILRTDSKQFLSAGTCAFMVCLLRATRSLLVPLWALHVGLGVKNVTAIFAISAVADLACFYPAGYISDRFGRSAIAYPCLTILSVGHIVLIFSKTLTEIIVVAILLGIGNGLGSGIVMTLGADRAPEKGRAEFLSVWRFVSDSGSAVGPLLCSAILAFSKLSAACIAIGSIGLISTALVIAFGERNLETIK